jgi:plastocyanin
MNKIIPIGIIIIVIVIIIGTLAYQTTVNKSDNNNMTNMSNMTSANSSSNGLQATVTIENGTFNPANLTVKVGTTVTWIDKDSNTDTEYMVTSNKTGNTEMDNNTEATEGMYLFMSNDLTNGQSFNYTFNQTGTFDYYDMDHMNDNALNGVIIVQ